MCFICHDSSDNNLHVVFSILLCPRIVSISELFSYAFLSYLQVKSQWYILTILRVRRSKRESARITITRIRDSRLTKGKSTKLLAKRRSKAYTIGISHGDVRNNCKRCIKQASCIEIEFAFLLLINFQIYIQFKMKFHRREKFW